MLLVYQILHFLWIPGMSSMICKSIGYIRLLSFMEVGHRHHAICVSSSNFVVFIRILMAPNLDNYLDFRVH